jgi:aryl-alcohol dehydrogenase-like predicted oxidoreductase
MRLTGPGVWGEPEDPAEAIRVLHRAVELGVNFIDTADSYGPFVSERLIREALHPYPADVLIASKAGFVRTGPSTGAPLGRPDYLRQQTELSLRHLGVERIDLHQLHRIDPQVPLADQVGEFIRMREEGKIGLIGLSQVSVEQLDEALAMTPIATVQNRYNLVDRSSEALLERTTALGIGFIPWYPLGTGDLARHDGPLAQMAAARQATPSQIALAWLLRRSPVMLPIPGTSTVGHLEENVAAATVELTDEDFEALDAIGSAA